MGLGGLVGPWEGMSSLARRLVQREATEPRGAWSLRPVQPGSPDPAGLWSDRREASRNASAGGS